MRRVLWSGLTAGLLIVTTIGSVAAQGDAPPTAFAADLERIEVPDAGLAIALPSDWAVQAELDYSEFDLGLDFGGSEVGYIRIVLAEGENGARCEVRMYSLPEGTLSDLADEVVGVRSLSETAAAQATPVQLAVGEAYRVDVQDEGGGYSSVFLWNTDVATYELHCQSAERQPDDWMDLARTIEWLPGSRHATAQGVRQEDLERVEVPEAGIAVSFPSDFVIEVDPWSYEMTLPPDGTRATPVTAILSASGPDGPDCALEMFEENPLSLAEYVAWVEQINREDPEFEGTIGHGAVSLPLGDGLRIDGDHQSGGLWTTIYLVDHGGTRYQLYCLDDARADDDYLSIAETIEVLGDQPAAEVPPGVPEDAAAWSMVEQFATVIPVSDAEEGGWLASAWCERAVWIEHADGSLEERLDCQLTDDPVDPPEWQAAWPTELVMLGGGSCEWLSDFWTVYDGTDVWAAWWALSVEPDGRVAAMAGYVAEAPECRAGE